MKITEIRIFRGPNYWSINHKVIAATLDIGKFEDLPSDRIPFFTTRLVSILPGLTGHGCSKGSPGGFIERLRSGTWMGHIAEHIAIELQNLAGMECSFGQTRGTGVTGVYNMIFEYVEEEAGVFAAHAAIRIAEAVADGEDYDISKDVSELRRLFLRDRPGPSTDAIVKAAQKRNIPVIRLDMGTFVQLGYGSRQKRIDATITENTSAIAVDLATDKIRTKEMLLTAGLPVPEGTIIYEAEELDAAISAVGYPLAVKPNDRNHGKGVSLDVRTREHAISSFENAKRFSKSILIEKYYPGHDYRLLVINYRLVAAALRTPAHVAGDGKSTIKELITKANLNPLRGDDHENILTKIKVDTVTEEYLRSRKMSMDYIPPAGKKIWLRRTANMSTGATADDITAHVHPEIAGAACRAAMTIGLDICGIDFICRDISKPLKKSGGVILEVNAAPGFRMHTHPFSGKPQPVGEAVTDMLFPGESDGRIPVVAITGTNGKTTTTRLVAHIARTAGYTVGYTTTEGIYINSLRIEEGDCTGPVSARKVLCDRSVDFAVLECARGGILRSGLAFDHCDTGVVTNVAEDHIGLKGINSLEDMASVKSIVPESVTRTGFAVLNANDDSVYRMMQKLKCNIALFSINSESPRIRAHLDNGGVAAVYNKGLVILQKGDEVLLSINAEDIPGSFGCRAPFMIENILAAMLAAWTRNISEETIRQALLTFVPSYENSPGRMNIFRFPNFTFLLDYAHNFHGISALGAFINQYEATVKTGIVSAAGDRRDIDLFNVGKASAEMFDKIIIRVDEDTRGRKESEIIELIYSGIVDRKKNFPVEVIKNEADAVNYALTTASPGSLVVHFADKISRVFEVIEEFRQKVEAGEIATVQK